MVSLSVEREKSKMTAEKMLELKMRVLEEAGICITEITPELVKEYEKSGELTENGGRDGKDYLWFIELDRNPAGRCGKS